MSESTTTAPVALPLASPPAPSKHRRWPWIVGIIVAFFFGIGIGESGQPTPTTPPTVSEPSPAGPVAVPQPAPVLPSTPPVPAGPADTIDQDGTYVIGTELQPGTYHTSPAGECYWARLSSTANESDIIANHIATGPTTVTIDKTDAAFLSQGCGTWTKVK